MFYVEYLWLGPDSQKQNMHMWPWYIDILFNVHITFRNIHFTVTHKHALLTQYETTICLTSLILQYFYFLLCCLFLLYGISTGGQSQLSKPGRIMQQGRGEVMKCLVRSHKMVASWSEKMVWEDGWKKWSDLMVRQDLGKMVWLDGGAQWLGCPPASQLRLGRLIPNICACLWPNLCILEQTPAPVRVAEVAWTCERRSLKSLDSEENILWRY